ncbi:MAG: Coenzyme F420 hydrogenase/dehydrogenase, beta subunit C-terminal domain [Elusimicrobiales bacterium]|jgi:coenzyme F420-reducing hydrogenase beta subunit
MANVSQIIKNELCSGCGVCAGVCPIAAIEMNFNAAGEYNPDVNDACTNCGLCLKVCPFFDPNPNEDEISDRQFKNIPDINYNKQTGYYLDCFAGFAPEYREISASGGLLSFTLQRLFGTGAITKAVCVIPNADPQKLFKFTVINSASELAAAAGSVYYPVEMSEIVREITKTPGNYAVVGLPCFIKAIRNATIINSTIKDRVKFCLGLTCGQLKSKYYTRYLACKAGLNEELKSVKFRGKDLDRPVCIIHEFVPNSGRTVRVYWSDIIAKVFTGRMFALRACSFCDDIFAECADAVFMDAWHPKYSENPEGTSFVINRSLLLNEILSSSITVQSVDIENVILSQSGVINIKRSHLAYRLYLARKAGQPVPNTRILPLRKLNFFNRKEVEIKEALRAASKGLAETMSQNGSIDISKIDSDLKPLFVRQMFWATIYKVLAILLGRR